MTRLLVRLALDAFHAVRGWWWAIVYAGRPTVIALYRRPTPGGGLCYVRLRHWLRGGPTPYTRLWLAAEKRAGCKWEECK